MSKIDDSWIPLVINRSVERVGRSKTTFNRLEGGYRYYTRVGRRYVRVPRRVQAFLQ